MKKTLEMRLQFHFTNWCMWVEALSSDWQFFTNASKKQEFWTIKHLLRDTLRTIQICIPNITIWGEVFSLINIKGNDITSLISSYLTIKIKKFCPMRLNNIWKKLGKVTDLFSLQIFPEILAQKANFICNGNGAWS